MIHHEATPFWTPGLVARMEDEFYDHTFRQESMASHHLSLIACTSLSTIFSDIYISTLRCASLDTQWHQYKPRLILAPSTSFVGPQTPQVDVFCIVRLQWCGDFLCIPNAHPENGSMHQEEKGKPVFETPLFYLHPFLSHTCCNSHMHAILKNANPSVQ